MKWLVMHCAWSGPQQASNRAMKPYVTYSSLHLRFSALYNHANLTDKQSDKSIEVKILYTTER